MPGTRQSTEVTAQAVERTGRCTGMTIVGEPIPRTTTLQIMILTIGLPMFAFGALASVALIAISGMVVTLLGALIWARNRKVDPTPSAAATHRWFKHPVNITSSLVSSLALNLTIALLWWLGRGSG